MKKTYPLLICTFLVSVYEISSLILRSNYEQLNGYEIVGSILIILGLLSFAFIGKGKRKIAVLPLGIFIIGILIQIDFSNIMKLARLYEAQRKNAGVFYVSYNLLHFIFLPIVYLSIIINILLKDKIKYYVFIALTIIMIATIATSFYHVGIDSTDLALVGFKALSLYSSLYIYMRITIFNYDKLTIFKKQ